jgi:23S rRNA pseudouridine1911/1915/1917 synthase
VTVNQPLGDDTASPVFAKSAVREDGQTAVTHFTPLAVARFSSPVIPSGNHDRTILNHGSGDPCHDRGFTLARVVTVTGRKHQIRAHAQWLGHSIVGDKIYGPDARLYLDFIDQGWTEALAAKLLLPRQALHCAEIDLRQAGLPDVFKTPLPGDLQAFCASHGLSG